MPATLNVRWLGEVDYAQAWAIQSALFGGGQNHLLMCTHRPVFTLGVRGDRAHILADPKTLGADTYRVDRGGDVTFHGPGQLVGYPIISVPGKRGGGMADTVAYVRSVEQLIIDVVADLGVAAGRIDRFPGIWVDPDGPHPRKLGAVGVRLSRGRSMHGFALNVDVNLDWFDQIVPCGIADKAVTSLVQEGVDVSVGQVAELITTHSRQAFGQDWVLDYQAVEERSELVDDWADLAGLNSSPTTPSDNTVPPAESTVPLAESTVPLAESTVPRAESTVPVRLARRMRQAGIDPGEGVPINDRKPDWMRVKLETGPQYRQMRKLTRDLELPTVCEEAGCPNIYECWNEGTATFMLLGERCTRACAFCLVDTRRPAAPDPGEPQRIATAVERLGLDYAVLTMVARDDLVDGGAAHVADTVQAIKKRCPTVGVEVLISDFGGSGSDLSTLLAADPDVVNHNIETVARLQRLVRPSAAYATSLAQLARAASSGVITKSGLIVGMGETKVEVRSTLVDLAAVGVDIVTIGQYLRPSSRHLPVARWWSPDELDELKHWAEQQLGITHVEAAPLTRSSHHAARAAQIAKGAKQSAPAPARTVGLRAS